MSADDVLAQLLRQLASLLAEEIRPKLAATVERIAPAPTPEPLLLDWAATGWRLGGISETKVRDLWTRGVLPSVKIDGLRFTRANDLAEYVAGLESTARDGTGQG